MFFLKKFSKSQKASSVAPYTLIVGLISVIAIFAVSDIGTTISNLFDVTANKMDEVANLDNNANNEGNTNSANDENTITAGNAIAWGENNYNQLGDGTSTDSSIPVQVNDETGSGFLENIIDVAAGQTLSCAREATGKVWCWGVGQSSNGTTNAHSRPTEAHGIDNVGFLVADKIVAGYNHACALVSGEVACWGNDNNGALGNGTSSGNSNFPANVHNPTDTGNLNGITDINAGEYNTCAMNAAGNLWCWGHNNEGQMGNNTTSAEEHLPIQVLGNGGVGVLSGIVQYDVGVYMLCAVQSNNEPLCWGWNDHGGIGDGTTTDRYVPTNVLNSTGTGNLTNIAQISAGYFYACAIETTGETWCWGRNNYGQLGANSAIPNSSLPVAVRNSSDTGDLSGVSFISVSNASTCGILGADGSVLCWGRDENGQLGRGGSATFNPLAVPVSDVGGVGTITGVQYITGNSFNFLAIQ